MIIRSKGTLLQLTVATVMTTIAQCLSIDLPEGEAETFEADYLDNAEAGIPYRPTGRSEGGEVGAELWIDPVLASFQALTDLITNPVPTLPAVVTPAQIVFADEDATEWPFDVAGVAVGGTVALKEGVKGKVKMKLSGIVDYPT